jgi:hypothetical protein
MVCAVAAFLEFCYIARQAFITSKDLGKLEDAVSRFHISQQVFIKEGICKTISLPCQHLLKHYHSLIVAFGAPLGLCSSITESKHINAVKKHQENIISLNSLLMPLIFLNMLN